MMMESSEEFPNFSQNNMITSQDLRSRKVSDDVKNSKNFFLQVVPKEDGMDEKMSKGAKIGQKLRGFFTKYFLEGQKLNVDQSKAIETLPPDASLSKRILVKHRRLVGILIPFIFFQVCWWSLAIKWNYFEYFVEKDRWIMTVTMCFGAMVAGMTSEGGGAIAFPVMTLALSLPPAVARDFSLMIQSCGMTAAAFTIFWMKIKLEWHSIIFSSFGAMFGMVCGLEVIDGLLAPAVKKLGFVCIWFSFAFALFLLNRQHKRRTFDRIQSFGWWQALVLASIGFIGGIFSAIAGSGVDICSFSILSLLFRVSEKVSTPTSVVLMAINTCVGFYWRALMTVGGVEEEAWYYLAVCVPVVVFFAPFGSFLSSHFHRQVLASLIYILDTIALVSAFIVLPMDWKLWLLSVCLILGGFVSFFLVSKGGAKILEIEEAKEKQREEERQRQLGDA